MKKILCHSVIIISCEVMLCGNLVLGQAFFGWAPNAMGWQTFPSVPSKMLTALDGLQWREYKRLLFQETQISYSNQTFERY